MSDEVLQSTREGFGEALLELGENNPEIVALSANLAESTRVTQFAEKYPDRFFETGVAEQNMAGIAAGLALSGKIPFMTSFASFSPGRNWEQIKLAICYNQANVKIASTHSGLSVGQDGATHQALEDIALMRCLPNVTIFSPADGKEAYNATLKAAEIKGPVYLRLGREPIPQHTVHKEFTQKISILREGNAAVIIATGLMVYESLKAANELAKENIHITVANCSTIKPIDQESVIELARLSGIIITAEEHQITGGLGSTISEILSEHHPTRLIRIGVQDAFGESGKPTELLKKYHLDSQSIAKIVKSSLKEKVLIA
jgi:transketolase